MANSQIPTCRWGILTTGLISTCFVSDITFPRPNARAKHVIQAVAASSLQKARDFAGKLLKDARVQPTLYGSYEELYNDPNIDCVYIGTPHSFHKQNCLDAIAAGKNVFCEKAFTINAREAREVIEAARQKGVYIAEAMWLRHRPMVAELRKLLFEDKVIGDVFRTSSDFRYLVDIANLPETSRYKNHKLGAGTLLDLGIYCLTWAMLTLDPSLPSESEKPNVMAAQSFLDGIEVFTSVIMQYPSSGRQGIVTSTTNQKREASHVVVTIDGTDGFVEVEGRSPALPDSFTVYPKLLGEEKPAGKKYDFTEVGMLGFTHEADNTALDIAAGLKESAIMPWSETIRVMELLDEIRRQGGTRYPQDE